jgi:hypothetical protein
MTGTSNQTGRRIDLASYRPWIAAFIFDAGQSPNVPSGIGHGQLFLESSCLPLNELTTCRGQLRHDGSDLMGGFVSWVQR